MSKNSFLMVLSQKKVIVIFLLGKILRFVFFITFLIFVLKGAGNIAGYNSKEVLMFFLSFMIIDTTSQFLFREVYRFRPLIVSGDFDLVLSKPVNPLFRVLMGGSDLVDFFTIPPLYLAAIYVGNSLAPSLNSVLLYLLLLFSGFILSAAFHIAVLSLGIITMEIDHSIMIYRDLSSMGRFPIEIYKEPLRTFLTYFLPVGIMMSFPTRGLLGLVETKTILASLVISGTFLFASLKFWNFALKKYSSASS